jgi:hypothetical protein
MATASEILPLERPSAVSPAAEPPRASATSSSEAVMNAWIGAQSINLTRHAAALQPFKREEFGTGPEAPSEAHIQAVNSLITTLRRGLLQMSKRVSQAAKAAIEEPSTRRMQELMNRKSKAHNWVQGIERIWDFYLELFGQRQSKYANWLLSCDRIAMDCYQVAYMGLGKARSIPYPPPFSYMRTGFSPATFRRGIPLTRLGKQLNPFPLVQLPYHRLINPWTLGAVLHEVSHNLQSDLGLSRDVPRSVALRLLKAGMSRRVASTWTRWNREMFADMSGLLLGGPAFVGSLMDVVGRAPATVVAFSPRGPHPTPYLRPHISFELLRRIGFPEKAEQYRKVWMRTYPSATDGSIPREILETFPEANKLVVDTVCFRPFPTLGNKSLAEVIRFERKEQQMIEEAARRLAAGIDPGIIPARFLIGATRVALDKRLARPGVVMQNFYQELTRR